MKTRDYLILRAIYLLSQLGDNHKITVGEVSRWKNIPKSSVRRSLEKLYKLGAVDFSEFKKNRLTCRDFFLTENVGLPIAESYKELF